MNRLGRRHLAPVTRWTGWSRRVVARAAALAAVVVLCAGACSKEAPSPRRQRPDVGAPQSRRGVGQPAEDTTSLLTRTGQDSLIGAARGVAGTESWTGDCVACHATSHTLTLDSARVDPATCAACHRDAHAEAQSLYAGELQSVSMRADTMYSARVACAACHDDATFASRGAAARLAALDAMCVSCHGGRFSGMVARWTHGIAWREEAVAAYVANGFADARLGSSGARSRLQRARESLASLQSAGAVHNVRGAHLVLRSVIDTVAAAYARVGATAPPAPRLGPDPERNACVSCHYGVESATSTIFGERFEHARHILQGDMACAECHSDRSYFTSHAVDSTAAGASPNAADARTIDPRHGRTRVTAEGCNQCHHAPESTLACSTCHASDERLLRNTRVTMALSLTPKEAPTTRSVEFDHRVHRETACASCHASAPDARAVVPCAKCHTDHHRERATGCATCHGTQMLASHDRNTHYACASCHRREVFTTLLPDRAFCLSCHAKQTDHLPGRECSTCHLRLSPVDVRERILSSK